MKESMVTKGALFRIKVVFFLSKAQKMEKIKKAAKESTWILNLTKNHLKNQTKVSISFVQRI